MGGSHVIGIDVGGTVVKATAFDLETGVARTSSRPLPVLHPAPGHNERDAMLAWRETASVAREVTGALPAGSRIAAVGVTGHGNGLYLVDGYGRPTRHAVMASDTRASELVRGWIDEGLMDVLTPLTWNRLWPGQPGPILAWLQRHDPAGLREARHLVMCKDFIRAQLVGTVGGELTDQSCSGLYANATDEPCEDTFRALGIEGFAALLGEPLRSGDLAGGVTTEASELTGLPAGTPVVAGAVDNVSLHLGSGVLDGNRICVSAGTWSVNQLLVPRAEMLPSRRLGEVAPLAACLAAAPGTALLIDASATSAATLAWALDHVLTGVRRQADEDGLGVFEAALGRVAGRTPRAADPLFVPYLDGSRDVPTARGAWLNLSSWNDEDSLVAAVVEGVCMEHRRHVERLAPDPSVPVRLSGGAARSAIWAQLFADVMGRSVEVSRVQETGAAGAAILAGVGTGLFADLESGVAALSPTESTFVPDGDRARLEERYGRYREATVLVEALNR